MAADSEAELDPRPCVKIFTPDAGATWLLVSDLYSVTKSPLLEAFTSYSSPKMASSLAMISSITYCGTASPCGWRPRAAGSSGLT